MSTGSDSTTAAASAKTTRAKGSFPHASRLVTGRALAQDVWSIFNVANLPKDTINLGQGYMNFSPPKFVRDAAEEALSSVQGNHYAHPKGNIRLRTAIKTYYESSYHRTLDPETEITVTSGANEGMYAVWTAFVEEGDEVIVFEPFFDQYISNIAFNGGVPVYVPMHPEPAEDPRFVNWKLDINELRQAVTPRTKMIVVNTPHNPCGKVFTQTELEQIADIAKEFDLMVLADEVYDILVFDGRKHVRIANLPGMWERTLTAQSAGKAFAATGWRVGWVVGPPELMKYVLAASTRIVFAVNTPLQIAAAVGLEQAVERKYFETQLREYEERKDVLVAAFDTIGLPYTIPEGAYFTLLDVSKVKIPEDFKFSPLLDGRGRGYQVSWWMAQEIGVSPIPLGDFFCVPHAHIGDAFVRFAFCKDVDTLRQAGVRLQKLKEYI